MLASLRVALVLAWLGCAGVVCAQEPPPQGAYVEAGRFALHKGGVQGLAVSRDGRFVATVGDDQFCYVIDAKTWKQARKLGPHRGAVKAVAFTASGAVAVGGERDPATGFSVVVWDARSSRTVAQWNQSPKGVVSLALSADDARLAAAHGDGGASLWTLKANETDEVDAAGKGKRTAVALSPDGRVLLVADQSGFVYRWVLTAGRRKASGQIRPVGGASVLAVAFSPDSQTIATAHGDGGVRTWRDNGGQRLVECLGHAGEVRALAWSPDGKLLVSAGADKTFRVWDAPTGKLVALGTGHAAAITGVGFVGGGTQVASASLDGSVRLWRYSAAATAAEAGKPRPKPQPKGTLAVPTTDELAAAEKLIRGAFPDEFAAATTPAGKEKLAARLMTEAQGENHPPAERFAMLDAARQFAADAGSVGPALAATDELIGRFKIDDHRLRGDTLDRLARSVKTPDAREQVVLAAIDWIDEAIGLERSAAAAALAKTIDNLARSLRKPDLQRQLRQLDARLKSAAAQTAAYEAALARLKASPNDAQAHLDAGKHLVFHRGQWAKGLPHLAQGSDAALARIAAQDLARPAEPEKQSDLADAWLAAAETRAAHEKAACHAAAEYWYRQALANLTGLRKIKTQKSLDKLAAQEPPPSYLRRGGPE